MVDAEERLLESCSRDARLSCYMAVFGGPILQVMDGKEVAREILDAGEVLGVFADTPAGRMAARRLVKEHRNDGESPGGYAHDCVMVVHVRDGVFFDVAEAWYCECRHDTKPPEWEFKQKVCREGDHPEYGCEGLEGTWLDPDV